MPHLLKRLLILLVAGLPFIGGVGSAISGEVTVFAAASLKTALEDIAEAFENTTGHNVVLSAAGSSALARQIQFGAPADVFVSANTDWMDHLQANGQIDGQTRRDIARNSLVLAAHGTQPPVEVVKGLDLNALLGEGRLAMALVDAVPAGVYGKSALRWLGQWEKVQGRVVQTDNVRAALMLVAIGEAPLGVVYSTDVIVADGVSVLGRFPEDAHRPIVYPAARVSESDNPLAEDFLTFLSGQKSTEILASHGFGPVN